jgi:hypothetical protein
MSSIKVKQNRVKHKFRSAAMNMKETKYGAKFTIRNSLRQNSQIITTSSATNGTKNISGVVNVVVIEIKRTFMTAADKLFRHHSCISYSHVRCHHHIYAC